MRSPTTEQLIRPTEEGFPGWEAIAQELAGEVTRLRSEIDRLKGGDSQGPLESKADWTHPLYERWVEMGLDDLGKLREAWTLIWVSNECPACRADLTKGPYAPFVQCELCQLCFIATDKHFAIDTLERAQERGPDA